MREKNINEIEKRQLVGSQTHNAGMCPDQELNLRPFGSRDDAAAN